MENRVNVDFLSSLLSIPSETFDEWGMVDYLVTYFESKGYEPIVDKFGNIYVSKGDAEKKPLICAHIDTVHKNNKINIREEFIPRTNCYGQEYDRTNVQCLKGYDDTGHETGCGGDDKCGIYVCLEIFDRMDNIKLALFASEEVGCVGSKNSDETFFRDVSYAISFDAPGDRLVSEISNGVRLFNRGSNFFNIVDSTLKELDYNPLYQSHPYTDIYILRSKFGLDCINLSCGYYNMHRDSEYVCVDDVNKSINTGIRLIENLSQY